MLTVMLVTPEQMVSLQDMFIKFNGYAPNFTGPSAPPEAIGDVLSVLEEASIEKGNGGDYISHFGNKQWL